MPAKGQKTNKPAHNRLNLVGRKFTRLTVLEFAGVQKEGHRESLWKCLCDCGNKTITTGNSLTSGNTKSCGCYQKTHTRELFSLPLVEVGLNRIFCGYRKGARERNIDFKLAKEQLKNLIESTCYYCGGKPSNSISVGNHKQRFIYQGIDRLDNTKGYTPDNVVPCCIRCNKMKKASSHDEFILHILKVASWFEVKSSQADFYYETCGGQVL